MTKANLKKIFYFRDTAPAFVLGLILMASTAMLESNMGRKIWGTGGQAGFWSGDINSEHNSQYMFDPYTFSHILHGVLFYGLFWMVARNKPFRIRLLCAMALECCWELLENSDFIIERYRAQTISLNYYGDSIVNSMCDILSVAFGFLLASRLPIKVTVGLALLSEILMLLIVRDNLTINVIMLIRPIEAIKTWQAHA